jgi:hypothetical protein
LGLVLLTIPYWADYLASSYHRAYYFRLDENGSLVNTMMIVLVLLQVQFTGNLTNIFEQSSSILTAIVYGITLVIVLYSDYRASASATQQERLSNMLLYFPLMIAIPQLVYHYEFVVLIPLLPVLSFMWKDTLPLPKKICLALMAVGIALSQWQAIALYVLTGNMLAQYIPGIGLLFVIIGVAIYKLLSLKEAVINEAAGLKPS